MENVCDRIDQSRIGRGGFNLFITSTQPVVKELRLQCKWHQFHHHHEIILRFALRFKQGECHRHSQLSV